MLQAIGSRQQTPVAFDLVQARLRLYRCIAAGARGWYLRSQTPLDSGDESDLQRADFLKALNAEVDWLSPWIQASTSTTPLDSKQIPGYRGSSLTMNNSQLIVLVASGEHDSLVAPLVSSQPLEIVLPNAASSSQALRITHGRLEPVMNKVSPTESRVRLERPGWIELVVVTADPNVLRYLQQRSRSTIEVMLDVHTDTANQLSRLAQATLVEEGIPDASPEWRTSRDAEAQLRRVFNLASRDPIAAIQAAEESSHLSLQVVRRSWMRALNQFPKPQSSPWIENVQGLPIHWEVSRVVSNRPWMQHMVPGIAMSDWQGMEASGWHLDRRIEHLVESGATVMRSTEDSSGNALWLSAKSRTGEAISGGFAGSSMRVYSPPIDVPSGSLVRIDGRIQVRGFKPMPQSGLLVYDDVSGPASAILCSPEGADANGWQGFTLFRFLGTQQGVRVMMEVRGEGEYLVSDLRVSSLIPGLASGLPTTPVSLTLPSDR